MDKNFNLLNYWPMFHIRLTDGEGELPEDDLRQIETCVVMDYM